MSRELSIDMAGVPEAGRRIRRERINCVEKSVVSVGKRHKDVSLIG